MAAVEFYFDYSCPWSYLASVRLIETATRTGTTIHWRPVVVQRLWDRMSPEHRPAREPVVPCKAAYAQQDLDAWADYIGIPITRPADWPADAGLAAIGGIIAGQHQRSRDYSDAVFSAYFGLGRDITDSAVLADLAGLAGLDREAFARALTEAAHAARVEANIDTLLERGGFGVPTMFVGERMFFGSDRMPLVEFALGQSSDRTFIMPGQHG